MFSSCIHLEFAFFTMLQTKFEKSFTTSILLASLLYFQNLTMITLTDSTIIFVNALHMVIN